MPKIVITDYDMDDTRVEAQMAADAGVELAVFEDRSPEGIIKNAADADGMKQVMDQINQLEKTTIEQPKYIEFREYAPRLALVALGLLLLGFIADTTWCMRLP